MEKLSHKTHGSEETWARSIAKTVSYRVFVIALDFLTVFIITRKISLAFGFTLVSNVYTTLAYFVHERFWSDVKWGKIIFKR